MSYLVSYIEQDRLAKMRERGGPTEHEKRVLFHKLRADSTGSRDRIVTYLKSQNNHVLIEELEAS